MKMQSLLGLFALACLPALVLLGPADTSFGAVVNLVNSSAGGKSWDNGPDWSDGFPAGPGNDYHVAQSPTNRSLRTPNNVSNPTFPGDSLTIHSTGTVGMKHNGTAQIADLRLDGGALGSWVGNRTMGFGGTLTVLSPSTLSMSNTGDSRRIVIHSLLTGSGDLRVAGADSNDYVQLTNAGNTYTGNWTVSGGRLEAQGAGSLGSGNVAVNSGAQIDVDYDLSYSSDWILDGAMVLDQNHTLGNLTVGGVSFAIGTYNYDFLNSRFDAHFADGGSGSLTATAGTAAGTVYELNKNQPGSNSWNTGADWTNTADLTTGVVPAVGTVANVQRLLRTPTSSATFGAELNLQSGGSLLLKTSGTATLADGHLQGGSLSQGIAANSTGTFGGFLAIDSNSGISINSLAGDIRTMILAADLSGSGQLSVDGGNGAGTGTLRLTGNNAAYSGNWLVYDAASIEAQTAGSLGSGAVTINGGALDTSGSQNIAALNVDDGTATIGAALTAGSLRIGYDGGNGQLTATAGDFRVGSGSGDRLAVGWRATAGGTGSFTGSMDLSAADSFVADVGTFGVAHVTGGSDQLQPRGTVVLSPDNDITADEIFIAHSTTVGLGSFVNSVAFGLDNTVQADTVVVGGSKGSALATIAAGGRLDLVGKTTPTDLYVGWQPVWTGGGADGTLDLSGGTFNATLGTLTIAEKEASGSGTTRGTMIVDDGAVAVNEVVMANHSGNGNAIATLTIRGGTWTVGGNLGEPATGGSSTLNIDGGTVNVGGDLIVDNLRVGVNGLTGSVTVTGGDVEIGSGTGNNLYVGHRNTNVGGSTPFGFTGTLDLSGATSLTANVGTFGIGYVASNGSGQGWPQGLVTLSPDNDIQANAIVVADSRGVGLGGVQNRLTFGAANDVRADVLTFGGSKGRALVDVVAGGELNLASRSGGRADLYIGQQPVGTGGGSTGTLDLSGGTFNASLDQLVIGSKHADAGGTTRGEMIFEAGTVDANSVLLADHNGTQGTTYGTLRMRGGTLIAGSIAQGGGNYEFDWTGGQLTVGTFGFDLLQQEDGAGGGGTLAPGGSPGTTVIGGNYDMQAGIYEVEIGGLGQGIDPGYDFVDTAGETHLGDDVLYQGGADSFLQVLLRDGFQPDVGNTFDVLTATDVTLGIDFALDQSGTGLTSGGLIYSIVAGGNGEILRLQFVPEPTTFVLWALGAICLLVYGWRRRRS